MGMTKSFYHDEICAAFAGFDEAEYYAAFFEDDEPETATDWRLDALTGYMEFPCSLCGDPNTIDEAHSVCHDRERFFADEHDDDLPF